MAPWPGRVSGVGPELVLPPDPIEVVWSARVFLGPFSDGLLSALYLAIQAGRRARSGKQIPA